MLLGVLKALAEVATSSLIFVEFDFKCVHIDSFTSSWLVSLFCSMSRSKVRKDNSFFIFAL